MSDLLINFLYIIVGLIGGISITTVFFMNRYDTTIYDLRHEVFTLKSESIKQEKKFNNALAEKDEEIEKYKLFLNGTKSIKRENKQLIKAINDIGYMPIREPHYFKLIKTKYEEEGD